MLRRRERKWSRGCSEQKDPSLTFVGALVRQLLWWLQALISHSLIYRPTLLAPFCRALPDTHPRSTAFSPHSLPSKFPLAFGKWPRTLRGVVTLRNGAVGSAPFKKEQVELI